MANKLTPGTRMHTEQDGLADHYTIKNYSCNTIQ